MKPEAAMLISGIYTRLPLRWLFVFLFENLALKIWRACKGGCPLQSSLQQIQLSLRLGSGTKPLERWLASKYCAEHVYDQLFNDKRPVLVMWPTIWQIRWKKVPHRERKEIGECEAKEPIDYDRFYRDEQGSIHRLVASGVVMVEKDGREPPLLSSDEEEDEDEEWALLISLEEWSGWSTRFIILLLPTRITASLFPCLVQDNQNPEDLHEPIRNGWTSIQELDIDP